MPSVRVQPEKVAHLDESQRTELLRLLDGYADCFSDKPGLCDIVTHRIVTTPDFVSRPMRPRRVISVSVEGQPESPRTDRPRTDSHLRQFYSESGSL